MLWQDCMASGYNLSCASKTSFLPSAATQVILPGARLCNINGLPQSKHARVTSLQFGETQLISRLINIGVPKNDHFFLAKICRYF